MQHKIAIIGATGNVGRKIIEILLQRKSTSPQSLTLFASANSAGKTLTVQSHPYQINDTAKCNFGDYQLVLFATDSDISKQYIPLALKAGCTVLDSSSAYRLSEEVPLIVPPVNSYLINKNQSLYATANCLASPISVVIKPLHDKWGVSRIIASTYQSTSGAGKDPMDELFTHTADYLKGQKQESKHFSRPIPFNVIPQVDRFRDDHFTNEEYKIIREVQKIVSTDIKVLATSVRVPVGVGHAISLSVELHQPATLEEFRKTLQSSPGIEISSNHFTTPREAEGKDAVFVGRLRKDPTVANGFALWTVSDNLRRGAALDTVELAEHFIS